MHTEVHYIYLKQHSILWQLRIYILYVKNLKHLSGMPVSSGQILPSPEIFPCLPNVTDVSFNLPLASLLVCLPPQLQSSNFRSQHLLGPVPLHCSFPRSSSGGALADWTLKCLLSPGRVIPSNILPGAKPLLSQDNKY